MARRSFATTIGFIGGVAVLAGGLLGLVTSLLAHVSSPGIESLVGAFFGFIAATVLGLVILWVCRPRWWWWPGRRLVNGVLMIVLGVLAWVVAGGAFLTVLGAIITIVAGVLLPVEGFFLGAFGPRRFFHRRLF